MNKGSLMSLNKDTSFKKNDGRNKQDKDDFNKTKTICFLLTKTRKKINAW